VQGRTNIAGGRSRERDVQGRTNIPGGRSRERDVQGRTNIAGAGSRERDVPERTSNPRGMTQSIQEADQLRSEASQCSRFAKD
jgi:hypothetical protein